MKRRTLITLATISFFSWVGCGESTKDAAGPAPTAGQSPAGSGGGGGNGATAGTIAQGATAGDVAGAGEGPGGRGGSAGSGVAGAGSGGKAGAGATGGMAAQGGTSASGGSATGGAGTGGQSVSVPPEWNCLSANFRDGESCDCGCGAPDPDCEDETRESCDVCKPLGGCSTTECPGSIAADDNSQCDLPGAWACSSFHYGDGFCDCGCNARDVDCPGALPESCDACPQTSCAPLDCEGKLLPDDNSICLAPPITWECTTELYNDGLRCDCGCGAVDPDCKQNSVEACETCNAPGSCSISICPGVIHPTLIGSCLTHPMPPSEWRCQGYYGDNRQCDCGCGARDIDCSDAEDLSACDSCMGCGDSECRWDLVDPTDISQCLPPPEGWICGDEIWSDNECDCGCGAPDPQCNGYNQADPCYSCPEEGCSMGDCTRIDPMDNTQCL